MLPLLGPLAPVLQNVHDALSLCLLSEHHYTDGLGGQQHGHGGTGNSNPSPARTYECVTDRENPPTPKASHGRVPYFVLVRKLEEAAAALRLERDAALEEVARNQADLTNLDEQLTTAKTQLQVKTATIDKLMKEHSSIEAELEAAREATRAQEHKYEVLQGECVLLTREFLGNTMKLEEDLDQLRTKAAASEEAREAAEAELEKQEESPRSQAAPKN